MSKAVLASGCNKASASVDRSALAYSGRPRSVSANARIRPASCLRA
jgi:hypothetical protein